MCAVLILALGHYFGVKISTKETIFLGFTAEF